MSEPEFSYELDDDTDCITFFVDGEEAGDWYCDTNPDDMLKEFKRVFIMGMNYNKLPDPPESGMKERFKAIDESPMFKAALDICSRDD